MANKHYRQAIDVQVVQVSVERLTSELRWEPAAGSLYPHIYGSLNFQAMVQVVATERHADGSFRIPAGQIS